MQSLRIQELALAICDRKGYPVATSPRVPDDSNRHNVFMEIMDRYPVLFEAQLFHRVPETAAAIAEMAIALNMMAIAWGIDIVPLINAAGEAYLEGQKLTAEKAALIMGYPSK